MVYGVWKSHSAVCCLSAIEFNRILHYTLPNPILPNSVLLF